MTAAITAARMVHARRCVLTPTPLPRFHEYPPSAQGAPQLCPVHRRIRDPGVDTSNLSGEPYRPVVSHRSLDSAAVSALVASITTGESPDGGVLRDAVRALLNVLRQRAPGRTVEVRVPPFGAIQCVAGPTHTRGKPPNVVETDPITFVLLATGRLGWAEGVGQGRVSASGIRADLTPYLPLVDLTEESAGDD